MTEDQMKTVLTMINTLGETLKVLHVRVIAMDQRITALEQNQKPEGTTDELQESKIN